MRRPLLLITVGYITGIIWGLYLETNIASIIFLVAVGGYIFLKKRNIISKYKVHIMVFIFCAILSNIQINYLENRFDTLYANIKDVKVVRNCNKR